MSNKTTVSKEIYKRLAEQEGWVPSGEMETWHVLDATGSTITRKARLLQNNRWIAVRYIDGNAEYKALKTQAERDAYVPVEGVNQPVQEDELEVKKKYRYEPVLDDQGRPVAMRPIEI